MLLSLLILVVIRFVTEGDFLFPLSAERFAVSVPMDGGSVVYGNRVVRPFQSASQPYHSASNPNSIVGSSSHSNEGRGR